MTKYVLIKHYRGAPAPTNDVAMSGWTTEEFTAHVAHMNDLASRLRASGEFVDALALAPDASWVRYDGPGRPAVSEPVAESKDLAAGWMVIDVASHERALEVAAELSAAPGAGGEPIGERLEVRRFLDNPQPDA